MLCFSGGYALVVHWIPLEATLGILVWIGLIIMAQAYQDTPARHALAVSIGLLPALAAWGLLLIEAALRAAGTTLAATLDRFGSDLYIHGLISLSQGFVFSASLLAAILAHVIDRRFDRAAGWALAAAGLSWVGVIHAHRITATGVENHFGLNAAPGFAVSYGLMALLLGVLHRWPSCSSPTID